MTYYRTHRNLTVHDKIISRGLVSDLSEIRDDVKQLFLRRNIISVVSFPPFSELPAFEDRAELLEIVEIPDIPTFLDICSCNLAEMLNLTESEIDIWKKDLLQEFGIHEKGCKCGDSRSLKD